MTSEFKVVGFTPASMKPGLEPHIEALERFL